MHLLGMLTEPCSLLGKECSLREGLARRCFDKDGWPQQDVQATCCFACGM